MKLATFQNGAGARLGVVVEDEIVDLAVAAPDLPSTMVELLAAGDGALDRARAAAGSGSGRLALSGVKLLAPIPNPSKFLAIGLNYLAHAAEAGRTELPETPTVFAKMASCIAGPYDEIQVPIASDQVDYEGEPGIVIGRRCRHVSRDDAASVIAG